MQVHHPPWPCRRGASLVPTKPASRLWAGKSSRTNIGPLPNTSAPSRTLRPAPEHFDPPLCVACPCGPTCNNVILKGSRTEVSSAGRSPMKKPQGSLDQPRPIIETSQPMFSHWPGTNTTVATTEHVSEESSSLGWPVAAVVVEVAQPCSSSECEANAGHPWGKDQQTYILSCNFQRSVEGEVEFSPVVDTG